MTLKPKFKKDDFREMKYPVLFVAETRTIPETFPELKLYPEFDGHPYKHIADVKKIQSYAFLMYSPTVLDTLHSEAEKKTQAALMAGFNKSGGGRFPSEIEEMMDCRNLEINPLFIRVCMLHRNPTYAKLRAFNQAFYDESASILNRTVEKIKDTRQVMNDLETDINEAQKLFLHQDQNKNLVDTLYDYIDADNLGITPEEIAKAKKESRENLEKLIPNPYKIGKKRSLKSLS